MTDVATAYVILVASVVFIGGVAVLALGAWAWAKAIASVHQARYAQIQADVAAAADSAIAGAAEDSPLRPPARVEYVPPDEDELRASIIMQRELNKKLERGELNMDGTEGLEDVPPIPPGGLYADPTGGRG